MNIAEQVVERTMRFSKDVGNLSFSVDCYVYNPLEYAWDVHKEYITRYVCRETRFFFLGMNPGPFGMVQTGVPFGEVEAVRSWLGLYGHVGKPFPEHPGRPVLGFDCTRSEVSGRRLWGLMADRFGTPEAFFQDHCIMNYCPLAFLDKGRTARNIPVDALPVSERRVLEDICTEYTRDVIRLVNPHVLIGVGGYARKKLESMAAWFMENEGRAFETLTILHPSPGSPAANSGWAEKVTATLEDAGVWA